MTPSNSVEKEIALHRRVISEAEWLSEKEIIPSPESTYKFNLYNDWYMPGSESYILDFEVNSEPAHQVRLIAKACIKFCAAQTVQEWHTRREKIAAAGLSVPRLYSTYRADYIEEYVPMDLRTAFSIGDSSTKEKLRRDFLTTTEMLHAIGFNAISLHDIRSRGDDIVLIDFGSDLGGFTTVPSGQYSDRNALQDFDKIVRR